VDRRLRRITLSLMVSWIDGSAEEKSRDQLTRNFILMDEWA
jgi:hypothetical protein